MKDLLNNGLCYVGCSAGTYVMCPTVEVGSWKAARNRYGVTDFTALRYVSFLIKCHYTDDIKEKVIEKIKTLKYPLRVLKDNQAFLIEDNSCLFVGEGEEVKF